MDENEIGAVSVEKVHPGHKKQRLTYLKLTGLKLGYVLNFGEALMKDGITHDFSVPLCLCEKKDRTRRPTGRLRHR